jgi:hypothetical protein
MNEEDLSILERGVRENPLSFNNITDPNVIAVLDSFLPRSIGIEIECDKKDNYNIESFKSIPDIVHIQVDDGEQRYRIPAGIKGLICLYRVCQQLKINSLLNKGSGIHFHVDMTDSFELLNPRNVAENENWILTELDTWKYPGHYNHRHIAFPGGHNWIRFQHGFKTAEFRICEMSFEYEVLVNRFIHGCKIIEKLVRAVKGHKLEILQERLKELDAELLKTDSTEDENLDEIEQLVRNRNKIIT